MRKTEPTPKEREALSRDSNRITFGEVSSFYDNYTSQLLGDFVYGNLRFQKAIRFVQSHLPCTATSILDIGRGIGYSSSIISELVPSAKVTGLDISPALTSVAQKLFTSKQLYFVTGNVLQEDIIAGPFDVIVLIDCYEHIPASERHKLHSCFNRWLGPNGRLLITAPSPQHQEDLRRNNPEGLQVVDETVTAADMVQLASDVRATLTHFSSVECWSSNQYLHVCIERQPEYRNNTEGQKKRSPVSLVELIRKRRQFMNKRRLVKRALGLDI